MKRTIIDISEMSDSKEVYGQRPNPAISWFIYCLVALLAAALVYSFIGKMEIVATASGVIRPNDDVSTVASLVSGRVTAVHYTDGQFVREGDALLDVDMSETRISVSSLSESRGKYLRQKELLERFLSAVKTGENPFSSNEDSDEYAYYVQFRDFILSRKNSIQSSDYDAAKNKSDIQSLNAQVASLQTQLDGLTAYRGSIEQGQNLAGGYPDYETMYLAYEQELAAQKNDYDARRRQIVDDTTDESNGHYLDYYREQLSGCERLIESIEKGSSQFPKDSDDPYRLLYVEYADALDEYRRKYENARETYDYYQDGGSAGDNTEALLAYHKTMLEGYQYYLRSVTDGQDRFDEKRDSVYYRSQYDEYSGKYAALTAEADAARTARDAGRQRLDALRAESESLGVEAEPSEDAQARLDALKQEIAEAEAAQAELETAAQTAQDKADAFKTDAVATAKNTISQIKGSIAEKEIGVGSAAQDYNIATAKIQMESARAAMDAYQNDKLLEYRRSKTELENKIYDLELALSSTTDKDARLSLLDDTYESTIAQKRYQTLSQIDSTTQSIQRELEAARSNLRQCQIIAKLYQNSVDESGTPLSVSLATVERIASIMNSVESTEAQLRELDAQLERAEEQLRHGTVRAERSGIVNAASAIVAGDVIASGSVLATIIPVDESAFKVQIYVSSADMGNVKVGDGIKYNISALPSSQYGTVSGKVLSISKDALAQDGQYSGYFLVEGSIGNTELRDRDGNVGKITIGMQTEAKIVTQTKTIIRYLLEKINLF